MRLFKRRKRGDEARQREVLRCKPGTVPSNELETVPDQRCASFALTALTLHMHPGCVF